MNTNLLIPQVGSTRVETNNKISTPSSKPNKEEFSKLLDQEILKSEIPKEGLKFSNHALERIRDRGISMSQVEVTNLENAVETAAKKGSKEALVLTNNAAFIVSIPNKTVITAVDRSNLLGNVFTNIDSTVII